MIDYNNLSGGDLAFFGDAYYAMFIRKYLLDKGYTHLSDLHDISIKYVSRTSQNKIINALLDELNIDEKEIFKRGRNYNYKIKTPEYINASGFEALIGYLYLNNQIERLHYLLLRAIEIAEN